MSLTSNSSLTMFSSLFAKNIMMCHISSSRSNITINHTIFCDNCVTGSGAQGLLVINGTLFTLVNSFFQNNSIYGSSATLISLSTNFIQIKQCEIRNNFLNFGFLSIYKNSLIAIESSTFITFVDTTVSGNHYYVGVDGREQAILTASSTNEIAHSYVVISNCIFGENGMIYAYIQDIQDVVIHKSLFYMPHRKSDDVGDIYLTGVKNLRIWHSVFDNNRKTPDLYFDYRLSYPMKMNLLTLNSNFTHSGTILETSTNNFLERAESEGVVETSSFVKLHHEETSYAKSKLSSKVRT